MRRLKQCDEDIIPQRREREEELGREVVDNCGAILAPHRTGKCSTATDQATAFENGRRAAGGGLPRSAPGRGRMEAVLQQHRAEKAEQILYSYYGAHATRFGIWVCWPAYGIFSASGHGRSIIVTAIRTPSCFWRWSAAAITSSRSGRIGGCVSISTSVWCVWPPPLPRLSLPLSHLRRPAGAVHAVCNHIAIIRRWRPPTVVGDSR